MARLRRVEAEVPKYGSGWPSELADPKAAVWRSGAATSAWLDAQGVDDSRSGARRAETPTVRRAGAIYDWAHQHHASERWPHLVDHHWMNESGLRAVDQAADRAAFEESITQDQYTQ